MRILFSIIFLYFIVISKPSYAIETMLTLFVATIASLIY